MVHRLMAAAFVLVVGTSFVLADDFFAVITKVEGNKVTFHKVMKGEKGEKGTKGEETTLTAASSVQVNKGGKYNKEEKKVEGAETIAEGLKSDIFHGEKGVFAHITTDADNKHITHIHVMKGKKKDDGK